MGIRIMSEVWSIKGLKPTQKYVLIALADRASDDNHTCWPSMADLTDRTGLSERAIRDAISELESVGFVAIEHRFNKSNLYRLTLKNKAIPANGAPPAANAPPAPNAAPPAGGAGVPAGGAGLDRQEVPPNHQGTVREPSVGDSRPSADGQAYLERVTRHENANQPITMTTDWKPGEQFPALMMRAGVPVDRLTDELLAKFVIHHNGTSKPNNKWEAALVTWCKTEYASPPKTASKPPTEQAPLDLYKPIITPPPFSNMRGARDPELAARAKRDRVELFHGKQ